jgi:hypothetical protein
MTQDNTPDTNGWSRAEMFVLEAIGRIESKVDAMDGKLTELRVDVAKKGATWGAISGTIITIVGFLLHR